MPAWKGLGALSFLTCDARIMCPFIHASVVSLVRTDGVTSFPTLTSRPVSLVSRMKKQAPLFVDFTWGAGGTTSDLTLQLTTNAWKKLGLTPNMHLTCTNMPTNLIDEALEGAKAAGIRNICALRGDPPHGQEEWKASEGGFECALDLVKHIRKMHGDFFCISVSGYPEGHPNAITKVDADRKLTKTEEGRAIVLNGERYCCLDDDYKKELAYVKEKVGQKVSFFCFSAVPGPHASPTSLFWTGHGP